MGCTHSTPSDDDKYRRRRKHHRECVTVAPADGSTASPATTAKKGRSSTATPSAAPPQSPATMSVASWVASCRCDGTDPSCAYYCCNDGGGTTTADEEEVPAGAHPTADPAVDTFEDEDTFVFRSVSMVYEAGGGMATSAPHPVPPQPSTEGAVNPALQATSSSRLTAKSLRALDVRAK